MCEVSIPNKEISYVYKKEILDQLTDIVPQSSAISIQEALYLASCIASSRYMRVFLSG